MRKITLTQLRSNIYNIIDEILQTGDPIELERHGQRLRITPITKYQKLDNLTPHSGTIKGDPDDIVHSDWSTNWNPDKNR